MVDDKTYDDMAMAYERILQVMKVVISLQAYVWRTHFDTGLVSAFPKVVFHPINEGKVGYMYDDESWCFHLYPYGKTKETVIAYINMYVEVLERDFVRVNKRAVNVARFVDDGTPWRAYVDTLFRVLVKHTKEKE